MTAAQESEATSTPLAFESLGRSWSCRPSSEVNPVRLARLQARDPYGAIAYLLSDKQAADLEEILDDEEDPMAAMREFQADLGEVTANLGESRASRRSSRSTARR